LLCVWHGNTSNSRFPDPATEQQTPSREKALRDLEHLDCGQKKNRARPAQKLRAKFLAVLRGLTRAKFAHLTPSVRGDSVLAGLWFVMASSNPLTAHIWSFMAA
jgi:hypothetical protein